jgi:hypothetical protein
MKIGLNYRSYGDAGFVLYALRHGKIKADFKFENMWGKPNTTRRFEIAIDDDLYVFSHDYADISDCDRKIYLSHNHLLEDSRYDRIIITPVDVIEQEYTDSAIKDFLDKGHAFLSFVNVNFRHKNFVYYPLYSFVYHYYALGFKFLNYYKNTDKSHLVGIYHRPTHIGGASIARRQEIFNATKQILGDDLHCYELNYSDFDLLLDSYRYFGQWYNVHMSGYSDFKSSIANIITETIDSISTHTVHDRMFMTEKTTKSILFSKEDIFFIWYGNETFIPYLRNYGFWFLNFEFYDPGNGEGNDTAILKSVLATVKYLKDLKTRLDTNESVYKYLLNKYSDRLENNSRLFDQLINNCEIKEQVINLLKYE